MLKRLLSKVKVLTTALLTALLLTGPVTALEVVRDGSIEYVKGRVLVMPKAGTTPAEVSAIAAANGGQARKIASNGLHIIELPANASETAAVQRLRSHPQVKYAEVDRRVAPVFVPNDPYLSSQWHHVNIRSAGAWDISQGAGITVAIADTGVFSNHPDLAANMVPGWNFYDNNADTTDIHGHGTACAGTAAAVTNNALGVAGAAGHAKIMPLRITDLNGYGYFSMMVQAITYAADHGARVISISFGNIMSSQAVKDAGAYMKARGGLVTIAASNDGIEEMWVPTTNLIPVSATDQNNNKTSWSTYGAFVQVAAPGLSIWTTNRNGSYSAASGTSFSSPLTAGVIAAMMGANPGLTAFQIESLLFSTATDLGTAGKDIYFGYGLVNSEAGVLAAKNSTGGDFVPPSAAISSPANGALVSGTINVNVNATDDVGVTRVELRVNDALLATDTSSPFSFSWNTKNSVNGTTTLKASAYDAVGNVGQSQVVTVTVQNIIDTLPPTVSISSPAAGAQVAGTVTVSASASDNVGLASVAFYVNGTLLSSDTSAPYTASLNTRKYAVGSTLTLTAVATDTAGNTATSAPVAVTVAKQKGKN
jgi:subtilisin family serine protease